MKITIKPTGITPCQIELYKKVIAVDIVKTVDDATVGQLLVGIGVLEGWADLKRLEELDTAIHQQDMDPEEKAELQWQFLDLCLLLADKIIVAAYQMDEERIED